MAFRDIALAAASMGIPVTPLQPRSKDAFIPGWQHTATTDPAIIEAWAAAYPDSNCGAVATGRDGDVWFFEVDDPLCLDRILKDTGHDLITEVPTYMVRSRPGRGHFYFRNTKAALNMGNVSQSYVKHGDFSVRVRNMYVVAAGSIHPNTGEPYRCLTPGTAPALAPDWLVEWIVAQKVSSVPKNKEGAEARAEGGKIPHGYIHGWLVTQAGKLRNTGLGGETLEAALRDLAYANCELPLDDRKISQVARSFEAYPAGAPSDLILNQQPDAGAMNMQSIVASQEPEEPPTFSEGVFPHFPTYVFAGTSIYDNFVKPVCDHNSRIDYFMWLPAMVCLLNYVGTKVKIKNQFASTMFNGSQYLMLIGKRGETNKSSCVDDAFQYFNYMGLLEHNGGALREAEGRSVVWTAGSAEGLGIEASKIHCKNIIMYYDELSQFIKKAGIDGSTLGSNLLTMYESKKFGNTVKTSKEAFAMEPGSYTASLMSCCTPETFTDLWSKVNGNDSGLNDRFVFIYQPETLPARSLKVDIDIATGSLKTKDLIQRALQQGVFDVENWNNSKLNALIPRGNRYVQRAMKWALGIAIDLGLDVIDDECIDRGVDIVLYEIAVKDFFKTYDANSKEAALQSKIRRMLEINGGSLSERELKRKCHADREGTTMWGAAFYGLQKSGVIRTMGQGRGAVIQVMIPMDTDDE